jgi:4-hydroxy-tetrahydrodipicolinate reductase
MNKQIVAFQNFMENFAEEKPNLLKGAILRITESHQEAKSDTSGTAKAMVAYFNQMGIEFSQKEIIKIRDPEKQREIGIPEKYLSGHAWHTYEIEGGSLPNIQILFRELYRFLGRDDCFKEYKKKVTFPQNPEGRKIVHLFRESPDQSVTFNALYNPSQNPRVIFTHNVNGRGVYADGTIDAIRYLREKISSGEKGKVYSMIDVLKGN